MRVTSTAIANFAGLVAKPGASSRITPGVNRSASASSTICDITSSDRMRPWKRFEASTPSCVRMREKAGTKAELKAPSPKMARKWLGSRKATVKTSMRPPAPSTAAITTSRAKPVMRDSSVQPPTERIARSINSL
jgi:hypothetical protein